MHCDAGVLWDDVDLEPTRPRMSGEYHKPTLFDGRRIEAYIGGEDPAQQRRAAHETARALVDRGRQPGADEVVARMVAYTDQHGLDDLAQLWSRSPADTLPGALWRLSLVRVLIRQDPDGTAIAFERGVERLKTADAVIAGAQTPTGPAEVAELVDQILTGAFSGDLAIALDRAAACCRILAEGTVGEADVSDLVDDERASRLTARAARLAQMAAELTGAARLQRDENLD